MVLIKLSFIATPEIKQLFCVIQLFILFLVLVVVPITLAKQKEQLIVLGLILTVLFANLLTTAQLSNICLILRLCICHCLRHHTYSKLTNLI